jgi:hypothetical protein
VLAEPEYSRKKLRRYRLVALAVSMLFLGYFSARFPRFWVLATAEVLNRLSARLLGPWRSSLSCLGAAVLGLMGQRLPPTPILLVRGWLSRCEGKTQDVMPLAKQPASADPHNVYAVLPRLPQLYASFPGGYSPQ